MKLTIEHLAPYLPYGIKVLRPDSRTILKVEGIASQLLIFSEENEPDWTFGIIQGNKLILRPLSDLTKEIDHNGARFVPSQYWSDAPWDMLNMTLGTLYQYLRDPGFFLPYMAWQKLFEWHFDAFGLIEQGLAIDINTIKS